MFAAWTLQRDTRRASCSCRRRSSCTPSSISRTGRAGWRRTLRRAGLRWLRGLQHLPGRPVLLGAAAMRSVTKHRVQRGRSRLGRQSGRRIARGGADAGARARAAPPRAEAASCCSCSISSAPTTSTCTAINGRRACAVCSIAARSSPRRRIRTPLTSHAPDTRRSARARFRPCTACPGNDLLRPHAAACPSVRVRPRRRRPSPFGGATGTRTTQRALAAGADVRGGAQTSVARTPTRIVAIAQKPRSAITLAGRGAADTVAMFEEDDGTWATSERSRDAVAGRRRVRPGESDEGCVRRDLAAAPASASYQFVDAGAGEGTSRTVDADVPAPADQLQGRARQRVRHGVGTIALGR